MTERILEEQFAAYARDGDLVALGELFDRVAPELARLARRLAPDSASAEDLVQETFLTALERPGLYDPSRPLLPWLLGILTHRAREARRSAARRPEPDRLTERSVPEPDAVLADAELRGEIEEAVEELPESLRGVVRGRLLEERSTADVARELGLAPGALRMRLSRGLLRLRDALPAGLAPVLAPFFALALGRSVSGVSARGLAEVRDRVLAEAARRATGTEGTAGRTTLSTGLPAATGAAATAGVLMTKKTLAAATGIALLAAIGVRSWAGFESERARPLSTDSHELAAAPDSQRASTPDVERAPSAPVHRIPANQTTEVATLEVTVSHLAGESLPPALVVRATHRSEGESRDRVTTAGTDSGGRARLALPAGTTVRSVGVLATPTTTPHKLWQGVLLLARDVHRVELTIHGGATLEGTVVDQEGRAVPEARVDAWCSSRASDAPDRVVVADERGHFRLEHLGPSFSAVASADGFAPYHGLKGELEPGRVARDLTLELGPPAALRGTVFLASGAPAEGVEVEVTGGGSSSQRDLTQEEGVVTFGAGGGSAATDERGEFVVEGLPRASRSAQFDLAPYLVHQQWISAGEQPVSVTLDAGLELGGIVLDAEGRPAAGAEVFFGPFYGNVNRGERTVLTGEDGRFRLSGLVRKDPDDSTGQSNTRWRGVLWIGAIHAGHAFGLVQPVPPADDGDIVMRLAPELVLAGRVVDGDGEPLEGVDLWIEGERVLDKGYSSSGRVESLLIHLDQGEDVTDREGRFRFEHLEPGPWTVHASLRGAVRGAEATFDVVAGDEQLELVLDDERMRGVALHGTVRDAFTGEPVPRFTVTIWRGSSGQGHEFQDAEGQFELSGLQPGPVRVAFDAPGHAPSSLSERSYSLGEHVADGRLLPSRTLAVEIVDEVGAAYGSPQIRVVDSRGEQLSLRIGPSMTSSSMSAVNGRAQLSDLPAEALTLMVHAGGEVHEFPVDLSVAHEGTMQLMIPRVEYVAANYLLFALPPELPDEEFATALQEWARAGGPAAPDTGRFLRVEGEVRHQLLDAEGRVRHEGRVVLQENGEYRSEEGWNLGDVSYASSSEGPVPRGSFRGPPGRLTLQLRSTRYRDQDIPVELCEGGVRDASGVQPFLYVRLRER